jgi:hypothetical protein
MDNSIAFVLNDGAFWLSIMVGIFGVIIIGGVIWFGREIFTKSLWEHFRHIEHLLHELIHRSPNHDVTNELKAIVDSYADHRERRNEFWTVYGQIVLAIFVVVILTILLITKTISAEAGLPILSAVSGFAIAKGINSSRSSGTTINSNDNEPRG